MVVVVDVGHGALSREEWSLGALRNNNRSQCLEELPRRASCAFITPCSLNLSPEERWGGGGGGTSNGTPRFYKAEKGEVPARKGGG